jgi:hypothetical protein
MQGQRHRIAGLLLALSLLTLLTLRKDGSRVLQAVRLAEVPAKELPAGDSDGKIEPSGLQREKVAQLYREQADDDAKAETAARSDRPQTAKRYQEAASTVATAVASAGKNCEKSLPYIVNVLGH